MPNDRDIAFGRELCRRKILTKDDVKRSLAEVDRVAKLGLDKYLRTILLEQGKITPQQADEVEATIVPVAKTPESQARERTAIEQPAQEQHIPPAVSLTEALKEAAEAEAQAEPVGPEAGAAGTDGERGLLSGVYACSKCGTVVEEQDLRSGKAVHSGGRLYCKKCLSSDLQDGEIAAGCRIGSRLYGTKLGQVYKCKHLGTGRECAVEVIPQKKLAGGMPIDRLVQLGHSVSAFKHSRLLELYEIVHWEKNVYVQRELSSYFPLPIFIERRRQAHKGAFSLRLVLKMTRQLMEALVFAFDHGLVHGALCPDAVYLNNDGSVKIADLGLPALGPPAQKSPYVAPELRSASGTIDCRVDNYTIGIIAHYLLTLIEPPTEREGPLTPPDETPAYVDRLVDRMAALSLRNRFSTPRHVLKAIDECSEKLTEAATKMAQIDAELATLRKEKEASESRLTTVEQELQKLQTADGAALDRRALKKQLKELNRATAAERSKQKSLQKRIDKRSEQREQLELEG